MEQTASKISAVAFAVILSAFAVQVVKATFSEFRSNKADDDNKKD